MLKRGVGGRDVWCRGRRSQSAMEFLMTYGWAILIIAIVLSGLFYFGVFSSKGSVSCTIGDPFFCRDIGIKTNKIIFVLDVPRVAMVEDHKIEVKTEEGWIECPGSSGKDIKRSYSKVWCDLPVEYELEEGKKAEAKLTVYYTKLEARDVRHTIYGSGRAVVEGAISADCNGDYVDSIEVCDGNNFRYYLKDNPLEGEIMDPGENSCAAYYQDSSYGGTISCSLDCGTTYSYDCYKCGDKEINGDEKCDTNNLGGETCQSQGFDDGDLKCSSDCLSFDISGCYNYECGNENENGIGILDPNEECDCGSDGVCTLAELDQKTCGDYDFESGSLECMGAGLENECTLDSSDCYTCGDRQITGSEKCDSDKDGKVIPYCYQIEVVGLPGTYYTKGETSCSVDCLTLTSSDCSFCGNGIPEGLSETSLSWEQCDCGSDGVCSSYELRGKKCTNFVDVYNSFFKDGELGCTSLCTYNTYDCHTCGNGVREGPEECDGTDFGGETCTSLLGPKWYDGEDGIGLKCVPLMFSDKCMIDTSSCETYCGNGVLNAGEDCDDGNQDNFDGCNDECKCTYNVCYGTTCYPQTCPVSYSRNPLISNYCYPKCFDDNPACGRDEALIAVYKLDEGKDSNGDPIIDSSSNRNDGVVYEYEGNPIKTKNSCKYNSCYEFDRVSGSNTGEIISKTFSNIEEFSLEMWIYFPAAPNLDTGYFNAITISEDKTYPTIRFTLGFQNKEVLLYATYGHYTPYLTESILQYKKWHHLALTCEKGFNSATIDYYLDGKRIDKLSLFNTEKDGQKVLPNCLNNADSVIKIGGGKTLFDGYIDGVVVYDRVLSQVEINEHIGGLYDFCGYP